MLNLSAQFFFTETLQQLQARGWIETELLSAQICHFLALRPQPSDLASLSLRSLACPVGETTVTSSESLHIRG